MKKLAILSATIIFVALFSVASFAQTAEEPKKEEKSALLAVWNVSIAAPGQELPGTFKLEKDGDNYKGSLTTDISGEALLKNITIKDNSFTADITVNVQGQTIEGTIKGELKDGTLSGEMNLSGFGAISYSGKKADSK
jgi:hypothetical protein